MKYDYLVFDLDGTISDPKEGIVRSINFALASHGFEQRAESEISPFIGPPLDVAFSSLVETGDADLIASLVAKYRERYADVGYSENSIYEAIPAVIESLACTQGVKLGVCTSKRVDFAERVLELFSLRQYFSFVSGGDVGIEKSQQLSALLEQGDINQKSVMIGDRFVDLTAAHENKLHSAGVLWGYGSHAELSEHTPAYLFSRPSELLGLIV